MVSIFSFKYLTWSIYQNLPVCCILESKREGKNSCLPFYMAISGFRDACIFCEKVKAQLVLF